MEELDRDLLDELEALGGNTALEPDETLPVARDYGEKLAMAKKGLAMFQTEALELKKAVFALKVTDAAGQEKIAEYKATSEKVMKKIKARAVELLKKPQIVLDYEDYAEAIKNFVKTLNAPLTEAKAEAARKFSIFVLQDRQRREAADKSAAQAMAKLQEAENKRAEKKGLTPIVYPTVETPPTKTVVRTDSGTTFTKTEWKGTVTDPDDVDRKYCSPDPKKIQEAIDGGMRNPDMAGVDIKEIVTPITRTK